MENKDKPAYPTLIQSGNFPQAWDTLNGLTKREMFAMAAMQGLLSNSKLWENLESSDDSGYHAWFANQSKIYADELLKQLES